MKKEIIMPKIGLDMDEGMISSWEKQVGDHVAEGDVLCKVETDKAVTDVQATVTGVLSEIVAEEGDTVEITKTIAWVEVDG